MDIENKKFSFYRVYKISFEENNNVEYFDCFINYKNEICFINADDHFYFVSKYKEPIKITDNIVKTIEEYEYISTYNRLVNVCFSFVDCREDFSFSDLPVPKRKSEIKSFDDLDLHLLIIRYRTLENYKVSYFVGYKGMDNMSPNDWLIYDKYNKTWNYVIEMFQVASVLAWRSLSF